MAIGTAAVRTALDSGLTTCQQNNYSYYDVRVLNNVSSELTFYRLVPGLNGIGTEGPSNPSLDQYTSSYTFTFVYSLHHSWSY